MPDKKVFWIILVCSGLALLFVGLQLNSFNAPFERDEGNYAYGAWIMTKGLTPYVNTFEQKPPLIFFPYLLALFINPLAVWPIHLIAFFSLALTVVILGWLVRREYGPRAGLMAASLLTPMVMQPYFNPFAANTEKFMILPLVGLLAVYVFNRNRESNWPWFWAAALGTTAVLYKQIAIFVVIYIFLVWLFEDWQREKSFKTGVERVGFALVGALLTFVVVCGYFLARAGLAAFWDQLVVYNRAYIASTGGLTFIYLIGHLQMLWRFWPLLFFLLGWYLIVRPARWWFYLGLLLVGLASVFNTPLGHYYIMIMPFWAIVTAVSLDSLALKFKSRAGVAALFMTLLLLVTMLWPVNDWYFMAPNEVSARNYGPLNPFVEAPIVAKRVAELTRPSDYVFIAGSEAEIYYYAKRLAPSQITGTYGMMFETPPAPAMQKQVIGDLEKHPPRVIVWVRSPLSWLVRPKSPRLIFDYLFRVMKERYVLVGGSIRRGAEAFWQEPLRPETYGSCSIKVYKLKTQ